MPAGTRIWEAEPTHGEPGLSLDSHPHRLRITVVFTTIEGTLAALDTAASFARDLRAEIAIVVTEVVSFRHPLDSPPGDWHFFERMCLALIGESRLDANNVSFKVHFCRDSNRCLELSLSPHSLVVIGARNCWWPRRERELERVLHQFGHDVVLVRATAMSEKARAQAVVDRLLEEEQPA
jgi:hypothetical protein